MSKELATQGSVIESVVIGGDLSKLSPAERVNYYKAVCDSVGLNSLTRPFEYITLNGRLTLYARKDATDQLRKINGVSISKPDIQYSNEWIIVSVIATDKEGRTDSDVGVVDKNDMRGNFANSLMKAVTKAKRRVTLSICGLGFLDETEIETIPDAQPVEIDDEGEIVEGLVYEYPEHLEVIVNSKGVRYVDLDSEKLAYMLNGIIKASNKPDLPAEKQDEYSVKSQAIKEILKIRNEAE